MTRNFREFPKEFEKLKIDKEDIAMYCTGGIRCEKASAYLKRRIQKYFSVKRWYNKLSYVS